MKSAIKSVAKPAWTADADSCFALRDHDESTTLGSQLVVDRVYEPETKDQLLAHLKSKS